MTAIITAPITPAQERTLRHMVEDGITSTKGLARAAGITPEGVKWCLSSMADTLALPWGQRDKTRIVIEAHKRGWVSYLLLLLCLHNVGIVTTHYLDNTDSDPFTRSTRTRPGSRRGGRRGRNYLDLTDEILTGWRDTHG